MVGVVPGELEARTASSLDVIGQVAAALRSDAAERRAMLLISEGHPAFTSSHLRSHHATRRPCSRSSWKCCDERHWPMSPSTPWIRVACGRSRPHRCRRGTWGSPSYSAQSLARHRGPAWPTRALTLADRTVRQPGVSRGEHGRAAGVLVERPDPDVPAAARGQPAVLPPRVCAAGPAGRQEAATVAQHQGAGRARRRGCAIPPALRAGQRELRPPPRHRRRLSARDTTRVSQVDNDGMMLEALMLALVVLRRARCRTCGAGLGRRARVVRRSGDGRAGHRTRHGRDERQPLLPRLQLHGRQPLPAVLVDAHRPAAVLPRRRRDRPHRAVDRRSHRQPARAAARSHQRSPCVPDARRRRHRPGHRRLHRTEGRHRPRAPRRRLPAAFPERRWFVARADEAARRSARGRSGACTCRPASTAR